MGKHGNAIGLRQLKEVFKYTAGKMFSEGTGLPVSPKGFFQQIPGFAPLGAAGSARAHERERR